MANQIIGLMHKVTVRHGDAETVLFVACEDTTQARQLALEYLGYERFAGSPPGVSVASKRLPWGELHKAYTVNLKTGEVT